MDVPDTKCPDCGQVFQLTWSRMYGDEQPEHCPFCGERINYTDNTALNAGGEQ